MTITESRLKGGTLSLGTAPGLDVSCQVTNCRVNSAYSDDGDAVETLCGEVIPPGRKNDGPTLAGTVIQDWTAPAGTSIIEYLWAHDLETVEFTYTPNVDGPTITGTVRLEVPSETYGGDVNTRITSDFEWSMMSAPTFTAPVVGLAARSTPTERAAQDS